MRLYLETLPSTCPENLAVRGAADGELVAASLHAWKVDLLRREQQTLRRAPSNGGAAWSDDEVRLASCLKTSRAFAGVGNGPVMMPFIDLMNHAHVHPSCTERGRWVNEAAGEWVAELVAQRDLAEGDELTYLYTETPSKARMLTSFGFTAGMPSASLAAAQLPERDATWLSEHGCGGPPRTDLYLDAAGGKPPPPTPPPMPDGSAAPRAPPRPPSLALSDAALKEAVRCVRLRLYTPEEATWAISSGHLAADWGGASASASAALCCTMAALSLLLF